MKWLEQTLDELAALPAIGYAVGDLAAAEPTALAAMAFSAHGRSQASTEAATTLAAMQQANGMVSIHSGAEAPGWPTSLSIGAWHTADRTAFREHIDRGISWLLANRGRGTKQSEEFGHNTELLGWSYAEQTHSWVEPTAFAVLAMQASGKSDDPAAREAVDLLKNRMLPGGGLNYGNTYVLGQLLRPHIQPTGIGLLALAGQDKSDGRVAKSVAWLRRSICKETTPQSLAWGLLGLRAHGIELPQADEWLAQAASLVQARDRSPHKLALLALAAKGWPT